MSKQITDPIEMIVAEALELAKIKYIHEMERTSKESVLDFYLPEYEVYIECKHSYTERSDKQLKDTPNVILIQGRQAATAFARMITSTGKLTNDRETGEKPRGKYELEINFCGDKTFLNFWDWKHGNDVIAEIIGGKLFMEGDVEISFREYLSRVEQSILKRQP